MSNNLDLVNVKFMKLKEGLFRVSSMVIDDNVVHDDIPFIRVVNDMEAFIELDCVNSRWLKPIVKVMNKLTEAMWYSATITICRKILDIFPEVITEETKYFVPKSIGEVTELIDYILLFPRSTDEEVIKLLESFAQNIANDNATIQYAIYGYGIRSMIKIDQVVLRHEQLINEFNSLVEEFEETNNCSVISAIKDCRYNIANVMCIVDQSTNIGKELMTKMSLYQHEMHYFINTVKVEEYL